MIQRIQSLLLLFAGVSLGLEFVFPFANSQASSNGILADAAYNLNDSMALLSITVVGIILAFVAIFLYKNRGLQSKLVILLILVSIALPVTAYIISTSDQSIKSAETLSFGIGAFLPIVTILLSTIAIRFINEDENLVKSMDRLR